MEPLRSNCMQPEEARQVLDRFAIAERLQHIRRFVWRGGQLRFCSDHTRTYYELLLRRRATVLEPTAATEPGLQSASAPVVEGRWTERETTQALRVGITEKVPGAIFIRAGNQSSLVPYQGRPVDEVEQALQIELAHVH